MVQETSWTAGSGWAGKEVTHIMQPEEHNSRSALVHCNIKFQSASLALCLSEHIFVRLSSALLTVVVSFSV